MFVDFLLNVLVDLSDDPIAQSWTQFLTLVTYLTSSCFRYCISRKSVHVL